MNASLNARKRDRAFLYADHKDEQRDSRDTHNRLTPIEPKHVSKIEPIELKNVSKAVPE